MTQGYEFPQQSDLAPFAEALRASANGAGFMRCAAKTRFLRKVQDLGIATVTKLRTGCRGGTPS